MSRRVFLSIFILCSLLLTGFPANACTKYLLPKNNKQLVKVAVEITDKNETKGGSGVILSSSPDGSLILTNKHVCELIRQSGGGYVEDPQHIKHLVMKYAEDGDGGHDLAILFIGADLGVNIKLAKTSPVLGDDATIVGHPDLLPTIITRGMFSEHKIMEIVDGIRTCTDEEKLNPDTSEMCFSFGGYLLTTTREVQIVSATIMPGSSGSGVFNDKGELAGLVFAGNQGLGYAMVVPIEFIHQFLKY